MTEPRHEPAVTLMGDGTVLIVSGYDGQHHTDSAELYDPVTRAFTVVGRMHHARSTARSTLLGDGTVLVPGGRVVDTPSEIYNPFETLPAPFALKVTPATATMVVGERREFTVLDQQGRPRGDATWSVSDETLAMVTVDNGIASVEAIAAGEVTVTASSGSVSAQATITISALPLAPGTVLWSMPIITGYTAVGLVQAVSGGTLAGPSSYAVQQNHDGSESMIQALTADGHFLWERPGRKVIGKPVPDATGGLYVTYNCDADNPMSLQNVNAAGELVWEVWIAPASPIGSCPDQPKIALRPDGAIAIGAPANTLPSFSVRGGTAGDLTPSIPMSTLVDMFGQSIPVPATVSNPIVDNDGNTYVMYGVRQVSQNGSSVASQLYLLRVDYDDNSVTTIQLEASTDSLLLPGSLMPDGQDGVLATWTESRSQPHPQVAEPYQAAWVSGAMTITATYSMPNAPTTTGVSRVEPKLVLGEGSTAFAGYVNNVTKFNLQTGVADWNYTLATPEAKIETVAFASDGGLRLTDTASNQIALDASGSLTWSLTFTGVTFMQPTWTGAWQGVVAASGIGIASLAAPPMDFGVSLWATQSGFPAQTQSSTQSPHFPPLAGGRHEAMEKAVADLIQRLKDPVVGGRAQTYFFTPIGNDWRGIALTTASFIKYLENKPRFFNALTSKYCMPTLVLELGEGACFKKSFVKTSPGYVQRVEDYFATHPAWAVAGLRTTPLLSFVRPSAVDFASEGKNKGNLTLIFHEALHGITGLADLDLQMLLGLPLPIPTCAIDVQVAKEVLQYSPGLDPSNIRPCPWSPPFP
jgi:hypothetical protein